MYRYFSGIVAVFVATGAIAAQTAPTHTAPPMNPGDPLPGPFRSYIVTDERVDAKSPRNRTNKLHCLVCESDLNPTAAVFLRTVPTDPNGPAAKLLKRLDALVNDRKSVRFGAFAIFLTLNADYPLDESRDEKAKVVKDFSAQIKVPNVPFGLAAGKADAAVAYGIQDDHDITVILYTRAKVVKRWAFTAEKPPSDADVDAILAAAKELAK
jgi:hypothetical protein